MPNNSNNKKKKKSSQQQQQRARNRSAAAVYCQGCQKKLDPSLALRCVCTRVLFCNDACLARAIDTGGSHADCPRTAPSATQAWRPPGRIDEETATTTTTTGVESHIANPATKTKWQQEYQDTIQRHVSQTALEAGLAGQLMMPEHPGPSYYAQLADLKSSPACAYIAGVQYKNRMLGQVRRDGRGGLVSTSSSTTTTTQNQTMGHLESDELAFKYLMQAAEGGIGIAMVSLSELYEKGQGVRQRRITGNNWLWQAVLMDSAGAIELLDTKALMPHEILAMNGITQNMTTQLAPFQSACSSGPHLTSLVASFIHPLQARNFRLPPFAASSTPTLTVGNTPTVAAAAAAAANFAVTTVPLIGIDMWQELWQLSEYLIRRGNSIIYEYGRRGIAKAATAQTLGRSKTRLVDSWLYQIPPAPQCNDQYHHDDNDNGNALTPSLLRQVGYKVNCIHGQTTPDNGRGQSRAYCATCLELAHQRLGAIARGSVALSWHEPLDARGRIALWRPAAPPSPATAQGGDNNGDTSTTTPPLLRSDTFKVYSRGEVESVLAVLVECEPRLAHPLFVAQDPNFLWPIVEHHGTVRAALEYVAPHVDWTLRLGPVRPPLEPQRPQDLLVEDDDDNIVGPGKFLARCGNDLCTKLERDKKNQLLLFCSGCQARVYCSDNCKAADWIIHRNECAGGGGKHPHALNSSSGSPMLKPPREGEEIIVHGLEAKPQYNGKVGVIGGPLTDTGRYPVHLKGASQSSSPPLTKKPIALKPANIYQLGVSVQKKPGKVRKHRCALHQLELCDDCCLDMVILNHLSKLEHMGQTCTKEQVEQIAETNFATADPRHHDDDDDNDGSAERLLQLEGEYPMTCAGLESESKRFILRSLLNFAEEKHDANESVSREISTAINGLCCYSARQEPVARPLAVDQLQRLLS